MNFNLNKTMLLMGACTALGLAYCPSVHAASPSLMAQAVQQAKKVTGHIVDADGPVIGASVVEKEIPRTVLSLISMVTSR